MSEPAVNPSRRTFLTAMATIAGGAVLGALGFVGLQRSRFGDAALAERLAALLAEHPPTGLGRAFLAEHPELATRQAIVARLLALTGQGIRFTSREELPGVVAASVRRDFAHGRVTRCLGWVLSDTELLLAALSTLVAGSA